MNEDSDGMALFKLMVLGPLASRTQLARGELKALTEELAAKSYDIPGTRRCYLSAKTIARWYYQWRNGGFANLHSKKRDDCGKTNLSAAVQARVLQLKDENRARSLNIIMALLQREKIEGAYTVTRSALHRFLRKHNLSTICVSDAQTIERRSFEAKHVGDLWQADVLHGPKVPTPQGLRKTYLASIMDDKSRLIVHAAFGFGETAQDIELCLKQAILKRGLPKMLMLDNGSAYRSKTFQCICAKLEIRLVYCRPYEPQGKDNLSYYTSIELCVTTFKFYLTFRFLCAFLTGELAPGTSNNNPPLSS